MQAKKVKNMKKSNIITYMMFIIYILLIIRIILFKDIPLNKIFMMMGMEKRTINIVPLYSVIKMIIDANVSSQQVFKNIVGNIAIFVPMGIFLPLLFKETGLKVIVIKGIFISCTFEILQFIFAIGNTDIDDIILNLLGLMLGWFIFNLINNLNLKFDKNNIFNAILFLFGIIGISMILLMNSSILFKLNNDITVVNEELVGHLNIDEPDISGKFIAYDSGIIVIEVARKSANEEKKRIEMLLNNESNIFIETYSFESFLGQIASEYMEYRKCTLEEFDGLKDKNVRDSGILIWSHDGETIDDIIIINYNF